MLIYCSRGCGHTITVAPEMIKEAEALGVPIQVAHEPGLCPGSKAQPNYRYRMKVTVEREPGRGNPQGLDPQTLATVGGTVYGNSLVEAFDSLTAQLGESWQKVYELRHLAEQELGD